MGTPQEIRSKLLELGQGSEKATSIILEKAMNQLQVEKIVVKSKGKIFGQSFRLHNNLWKAIDNRANFGKLTQAAAFKAQLDEKFRSHGEFSLPYVLDEGTTLASINLQAHGRVRFEGVNTPHIPFGFEPGNYEGRTFPKSYYHFSVKLVPTSTYLYNDDLPIIEKAAKARIPTGKPGEDIPIWCDIFDKPNRERWVKYLAMGVFALATKGPSSPKGASILLKPLMEEFEAQLIIDWIDELGLAQYAVGSQGVTVQEWWWLTVGSMIGGFTQ